MYKVSYVRRQAGQPLTHKQEGEPFPTYPTYDDAVKRAKELAGQGYPCYVSEVQALVEKAVRPVTVTDMRTVRF